MVGTWDRVSQWCNRLFWIFDPRGRFFCSWERELTGKGVMSQVGFRGNRKRGTGRLFSLWRQPNFSCPSANVTEVLVSGPAFSNIVLTVTSQTGTIVSR